MISNKSTLTTEAKAWIKRNKREDEIVRVVPGIETGEPVITYDLFTAYDQNPAYLGRILFDLEGYWIYDGTELTVTEQEQLARFIINYTGAV